MSISDRNINYYDTRGRLMQLEFAMKAMTRGTSTIGICTPDSVLIITEKKITSKHENLKNSGKNQILFDHIGSSFSGISGDARRITDVARRMCLDFMKLYESEIKLEGLLKDICHISMAYSESDEMKRILNRPFGASIMLGAVEETPKLYVLDPSGTYRRFNTKALGSAYEILDEELQKQFNKEMKTEESMKMVIKLLTQVMQDKINKKNVEIMQIKKGQIYMFNEEEIENILKKSTVL